MIWSFLSTSSNWILRILHSFCTWLVDEDELDVSPMARMHAPTVPVVPPPVVDADTIGRLLDACKGRGLEERRDTAIILLLSATGMRRGELVGMSVGDVNLEDGTAVISGKTGTRTVPFPAAVCVAIDRYLRVRSHIGAHRCLHCGSGTSAQPPVTASSNYSSDVRAWLASAHGCTRTYCVTRPHTTCWRQASVNSMLQPVGLEQFGHAATLRSIDAQRACHQLVQEAVHVAVRQHRRYGHQDGLCAPIVRMADPYLTLRRPRILS